MKNEFILAATIGAMLLMALSYKAGKMAADRWYNDRDRTIFVYEQGGAFFCIEGFPSEPHFAKKAKAYQCSEVVKRENK